MEWRNLGSFKKDMCAVLACFVEEGRVSCWSVERGENTESGLSDYEKGDCISSG